MKITIEVDCNIRDEEQRDDLFDELKRISNGIIQKRTSGKILNVKGLVIGSWNVQ